MLLIKKKQELPGITSGFVVITTAIYKSITCTKNNFLQLQNGAAGYMKGSDTIVLQLIGKETIPHQQTKTMIKLVHKTQVM